MLDEIEYVGFVISAVGIFPTKQKLEPIQQAAAPKNVGQLQSFLGLTNFLPRTNPGGVDSACHPSEVGKMSASLLVSCVGVATR